ncbi:MAG: SIMPL domain-containing protein [Burkholderiales bacterium]
MNINIKMIAASLMLASANTSWSQNFPNPPPLNVVQLSASASVDVKQDLLTLTLAATREGSDPAAVQTELKAALDAALAEAKKTAEAGQLDVSTGNFSLFPRHTKEGRISTWQGRAELTLEGRDFERISQAAGRIQTLTVSSAGFGLSREAREKAEGEVQASAIDNFKQSAGEIARRFGFIGFTLREVSVSANSRLPQPRMRSMAAEAKTSYSDAPVPVEAGNSTVTATVSGSVQLK